MPHIDIRLEFDEEIEDFGDGETYTHYSLSGLKSLGTDLPEGAQESIAESFGQSDMYWIGFANSALLIIGGEESVGEEDINRY